MRPRRLLSVALAAAALLTLVGCNTFDSRAKANAGVFNTLDAATKARLRSGQIRVGDTTTEVYIALGQPDAQYTATSAQGETVLWTYNRYYQQYQPPVFAGIAPVVVAGPPGNHPRVAYVPVYQPTYRTVAEMVLRVTFAGDRVFLIESPRRP